MVCTVHSIGVDMELLFDMLIDKHNLRASLDMELVSMDVSEAFCEIKQWKKWKGVHSVWVDPIRKIICTFTDKLDFDLESEIFNGPYSKFDSSWVVRVDVGKPPKQIQGFILVYSKSKVAA